MNSTQRPELFQPGVIPVRPKLRLSYQDMEKPV